MPDRPEVRLRTLTSSDAKWVGTMLAGDLWPFANPIEWDEHKRAAELDEGVWATEDRWAWAVIVDGEAAGLAFATDLQSGDGILDMRLDPNVRGQGVGREVLRQLADHHFETEASLKRLVGRTHEHNVPMQRAFNAAGFRMEARFRDVIEQADGTIASEWGYALTRSDWKAGRHRADEHGYDVHGLVFVLEPTEGDHMAPPGSLFKFLSEGRRVLARYSGGPVSEGELAGVLVGDVMSFRYVQEVDEENNGQETQVGAGRGRLQRRGDGRLEIVIEWHDDDGTSGRQLLIERA